MKAIVQSYQGGALAVTEVPAPALLPGGILVRNEISLVSAGTERSMVDLAQKSLVGKARARPDLVRKVFEKVRRDGVLAAFDTVRSRLDAPIPLGYSSAGTVIAVAEDVTSFRPGQRVACAGAGYANHAEVVFVPRHLAVALPDEVPFEAAAFTTVGAIALQGLRLARPELGETVVVIGLGLVGLLAAQLARAAGCRVLGMDTDPDRCRLAESLGVAGAVSGTEELMDLVRAETGGQGADKVLIAASTASSGPVSTAGEIARSQGIVVVVGAVGLELPRKPYYDKELIFRISCSYGPGRYDPAYEEAGHDYPFGFVRWTENRNMEAFVQQLAEGGVETGQLVTHRYEIDEAGRAYDLLTGKGTEPCLGILLSYPGAADGEDPALARRVEVQPRKPLEGAVHLGVLGAGQFATGVLLPALANLQGVRLEGVCNATGIKAQHVARKFGFTFATTSEEELLTSPRIDSVVISTRHHLHAEQVLAALGAGKDVFVEKPLCLERAQLADIAEALANEASAPLLMVGFNRRFAPMARRLKAFLEPIREPLVVSYRVNAGFIPGEHWTQDPAQGGGRILGEVCHFVDFLTFLTGQLPVDIRACSLPNGGRYHDDNLVVTLTYPDGSVGTVTYLANGDTALPKERCEVFGGGAAAVLDNFRSLELVREGRRQVEKARLQQDKGHRDQLAAWVRSLREGTPAPIAFAEIRGVHEATFEIAEQVQSG